MSEKELIEYFEHVRYQVACYSKAKKSKLPLFSGSGFMLDVDGHVIFITAGHVATTHRDKSFIDDKLLTIQTNSIYQDTNTGELGCILVSVGGVVSVRVLRMAPETGIVSDEGMIDVSFAELKGERLDAPFVTQQVTINGVNVKYGEPKTHISSCDIIAPNKDDVYSVYGRVHLNMDCKNGQYILNSEVIFHTRLKYIGDNGDMCVLKYDKPVIVRDWKGLSGSPVLNQDGKLIGVACSIDPIANTLNVVKIQKIMPVIQVEIMNNESESNKKQTL